MTLGEKLKEARKKVVISQEQAFPVLRLQNGKRIMVFPI